MKIPERPKTAECIGAMRRFLVTNDPTEMQALIERENEWKKAYHARLTKLKDQPYIDIAL